MDSAPFERTPTVGPRERRVGPIVLLLPLLSLVLAVVWIQKSRGVRPVGRPSSPPSVVDGSVRAWVGRFEVGEVEDWSLRLAPLHADPRRQAFDARALRERFGLGAGEPYLVEVTYLRGAEERSIEPLRIVDDGGVALTPLSLPIGAPSADPLAVLLAGGDPMLEPESRSSVVVWGRAPGAGVRVELAGVVVSLEPRDVPAEEVVGTLARLEESP